jgi:hypothetical protein
LHSRMRPKHRSAWPRAACSARLRCRSAREPNALQLRTPLRPGPERLQASQFNSPDGNSRSSRK